MIPPNPFDPDASFVPEPLERLFAAVADVSREYNGSSEDAIASKMAACKAVVDAIYHIDSVYRVPEEDNADVYERAAVETAKELADRLDYMGNPVAASLIRKLRGIEKPTIDMGNLAR